MSNVIPSMRSNRRLQRAPHRAAAEPPCR
jgi:hypothetical protein